MKKLLVMSLLLIGFHALIGSETPKPIKEIKNGITGWWVEENRLNELLNTEELYFLQKEKIKNLTFQIEYYQTEMVSLRNFMKKQEQYYLKQFKYQRVASKVFLGTSILFSSLFFGLLSGILVFTAGQKYFTFKKRCIYQYKPGFYRLYC